MNSRCLKANVRDALSYFKWLLSNIDKYTLVKCGIFVHSMVLYARKILALWKCVIFCLIITTYIQLHDILNTSIFPNFY